MAQAAATKRSSTAKKTGTAAKGRKKSATKFNHREHEEAAYFSWLNRGAPIGDDQHDWFLVTQ
ncbi:MAG: DUF2934 domain-containing protein [Deltaproteobacteria bacterium]|nr:DUF2934 domain-containing protein [Deltaproteobacteria bacterium]